MWDLWWTKWRWGRFSPNYSVSPANLHSTILAKITITYHLGLVQQASSGRSTKSPTPLIKKIHAEGTGCLVLGFKPLLIRVRDTDLSPTSDIYYETTGSSLVDLM
jgi:hypothetical protein